MSCSDENKIQRLLKEQPLWISEYAEGASLCDELNIAKTTKAFKRFARS